MFHTSVKQKVTKMLGDRWTHGQIAQQIGVSRCAVTFELNCTGGADCRARHTPSVQEAVAKAVGMSVPELFGRHAWYRLAAKRLLANRRAS